VICLSRLTKIWRLAEGRRSIGESADCGGRAPKDGLMVPITIGVPVYNGADLLDESLACLARQTFRDFKVLIYDNGSTDATPEIAAAWVSRDDRFRHVRQPKHVSAVVNFRDVLLAAESPWFMWRADDDLSADDYVEKLYRLATNSQGCKLAVSTVVSCDLDGGRRRVTPPPEMGDAQKTSDRVRALFAYHVSWFYGLWDRKTLESAFLPLCARYPFAFAADNLALYGPIVDGAVRSTAETEFTARTRRTAATPRRQTRTPFPLMVETRRAFRRELVRIRSERKLSGPLRAALIASEPLYLERAVVPLLKMARTGLREVLGIAGPRRDSRYFERNN
jgi:glycosyltransferase involved in cell wall biosynthesis